VQVEVTRVETPEAREQALAVLRATYLEEKNWVADQEQMFAQSDLENPDVSWFVCFGAEGPVGVLRVLYDPPLELYREYGFQQIGAGSGIDVEAFLRDNRIAEIGRFAVLPESRRSVVYALSLMRAASEETVRRGYSHYVTDIFEGEKHSPYEFHTRVMGFIPVATHDVGELNTHHRRITLILDLRQAYWRLKTKKKKVYRLLTDGWSEELHQKMAS
jgi:hypothetical protein